MMYHIAPLISHYFGVANIFQYVSVRAACGLLSALFCSFIWGNRFIERAKMVFRAKAREYTPDSHQAKNDMPTMGGLFILLVSIANILCWCNLSQPTVWLFIGTLVGYGAIGGIDDWSKIKQRKGIWPRTKFFLQLLVSFVVMLGLYMLSFPTTITFPFIKWLQPDIGLLFIPWGMFLLTATSNAVNLTDGLDGLAITSLIPNFATFSAVAYLAGHYTMAHYLYIPFAQSAEIAIIGAILVGSSIGFLWYNAYPAQIFMGDVGALALGAALALMSILAKQELLLLIAGGLFVTETVSVILQVWSYKHRGKRIFKMAPLHHHFELIGWQESKITIRFGIISLVLCLCALITLKMR